MYLIKALVFRRQVFQWLIPLISLWVAIVYALAISGAAVAESGESDDRNASGLSRGSTHEYQAVSQIPGQNELNKLRSEQSGASSIQMPVEIRASRPSVIDDNPQLSAPGLLPFDGDPDLTAQDLLSAPTVPALWRPLFIESVCPTPMSLMLHSSFGPVRMHQLAREILVQGLKTTTYRDVTVGLQKGECPASNSIIVSLDDFGTDWLRPYFRPMINAFTKRGLSLVVAVNVHGAQDPDAWIYLRDFEAQGNEVANHTIDHYNLARLEPEEIRHQINGAHQIICQNLGSCPETLILPFGINDLNGIVMDAAASYSYVVGIPGGLEFSGAPPYYLGRIGPDNYDQQKTLRELAATFSSPPTAGELFMSLRSAAGRGCAVGPSPSIAMPLALCASNAPQAANSAPGVMMPPAP